MQPCYIQEENIEISNHFLCNGVSFYDSNEIQSHYYFTKYQLFIFNKTALHIAVQKKNKKIIKLLISHPNIDINIKDDI